MTSICDNSRSHPRICSREDAPSLVQIVDPADELRDLYNQIARVLFFVYQGQMVLLHGFIKRTQQTP
jgi:phage-related protein